MKHRNFEAGMEELSNMLNRLLHRGDEEEIRQDELKKQIDAIYWKAGIIIFPHRRKICR